MPWRCRPPHLSCRLCTCAPSPRVLLYSVAVRTTVRGAEETTMPGGGGDPAAQSVAIQMKGFHPGRSPKPGAFDRHLAGLTQSLALPHRDYCSSVNSTRRHLRRRLLQADPGHSEVRLALLWDLRHLEATCRRGAQGRSGATQSLSLSNGSNGPNPTPGAPPAPASSAPGPGAPGAGPTSPHYLAPPEPPDLASCVPEVFLPALGCSGPTGGAGTSGAAAAVAATALPATGPPPPPAMVRPARDIAPPTRADRETMGADLGPPVPPKTPRKSKLLSVNPDVGFGLYH